MRNILNIKHLPHFILAGLLCLFITFVSSSAWAGWYDSNWSYRKQITIDQSIAPSDQPWFPVLIYEAIDAQLEASACANGEDILFTKSDGTTKMDHEIENFDSGTGKLTAWVEIETLSSSSNTVIYMYYGNGGCVNEEDVPGTWDEGGSNYFKGVWHLKEEQAGITADNLYVDSTTYDNHANDRVSDTGQTGQIYNGQEFDGSDDYIDAGNDGSLGVTPAMTLSAWTKLKDDTAAVYFRILSKKDVWDEAEGYELTYIPSLGEIHLSGSGADTAQGTLAADTTDWHHVVAVLNGTTATIYADGADVTTNNTASALISGSDNLYIGDGSAGSNANFNGFIDEARVVATDRSANWIVTEFNNQNNPAAYLTFDPQEKVISGTAYTDEGSTLIGNGAVIRLLRNGSSVGTYTTTGGTGTYAIPVATLNTNDDLLVYIDGHASDGTTVTVSDGNSLAGLDIYGGHLITRHDNGGSLTNAMMKNAKEPYVDGEILYSVDGSNNLTVSGSGTELYVWSGDNFTPGANVDTTHVKIEGTWTATGSEAYTVSGSWENNGTFDDATSTVTFDATTTGQTITSSGSDFYNVVFNGSGGEWTLQDNFRQNSSGTTAFTDGELIFNGFDYQAIRGQTVTLGSGFTLTIGSGRLVNNGNTHINVGTGSTVTISTGYMGVNNLTVNGSGVFTCTGNSQINAAGNINITSSNWTPGTSTINHIYLTKTLNTTQPLYNYIVGHSGLSYDVDITLQNNITIQNNFTIEAGTGGTKSFDAAGYTMNVGGNWDSSGGTFTHGNNTVIFDAGTTGHTITSGGESFYDVDFNNAAGAWTIQDTFSAANDFTVTDTDTTGNGVDTNNQAVNVTRDFTLTAGYFTAGTSTITVGRNWDSSGMENQYSFWNSTVVLTGTGTVRQRTSGGAYNYLFGFISLAAAGQTTTLTSGQFWTAQQMTVGSGTFTDGAGSYTVYLQGTGDVLIDGGATITVQNLYYRAGGSLNVVGRDYTGINTLGFYGIGQPAGTNDNDMQGNIIANNIVIYPNNGGGDTTTTVLNTNNYTITATSLALGSNGDTNNYARINAGSSAIDINGNVIIYPSDANGTNEINAGSSSWTVSGNWTNNDTFTPGTSTVQLDGGNQTINGSTTFNNLTKSETTNNGSDVTLTFNNTGTQTINGILTLDGLDGDDRINLVSDSPGNHWDIVLGAAATKVIDYVDVSWSDASGSNIFKLPVNPVNSIDGGNTIDWFGVMTSGIVYSDEGTTNVGSNINVRLLVNGVTAGTDLTDTNGRFQISAPVSSGDRILVYVDEDDGNGTTDGTAVTVSDGSNLYDLDIYYEHVITRHDNAGSLTNALMKTAKEPYVDTEIRYSVDGSNNLTVSGSNTVLYIPAGHSYAPGANVTSSDMKSLGTFNGAVNAININGDITVAGGNYMATSGNTNIAGDFIYTGGVFNNNTGTFIFDSGGTSQTVNSGAAIFNDVNIVKSSVSLIVTGTMDVDGDLTITSVSQINTGTIAVSGNVLSTDSSVGGSATILFDGGNAQLLSASGGTGSLPDVDINKSADTLTIQDTINVTGDWTYTAGTVDAGTSTIALTNTGGGQTINSGTMIFNDVTIAKAGVSMTVTGTMDVDGDLTISSVNQISTGTIAVSGNVISTDTSVGGSGTILFDGGNVQLLSASGGTGSLPRVAINKSGGTLTIQDTQNVTGHWTYTAGTVDASTSTIRLTHTGWSQTIDSGAMAFNDVEIIKAGVNLTVTGTMDINGNLTITSVNNMSSGTITVAGNLTSTDSAVNNSTAITLDGTGTQNIDMAGGDLPDGVFIINKSSGTALVISDMTTALDGASQDLTISQGTLDLNGFNLTVPDVLTVDANGILQLEGGETVSTTTTTLNAGSTVLYDGAGSYTGLEIGNTYSNLTFNGSGTWTLDAPLDVNADITITSGTLDVDNVGNHQINVAGNWSNSGTFNAQNGLVVLDGSDQGINGSTTFYSLTKTESSDDASDVTLTFDNTAVQTFNGTLTLDGLDDDDRINFVSDSPGNHWDIVLTATATKAIDYVDVSWSDASGSDASMKPLNPVNSINGGNTIDWFGTGISGTVYTDEGVTTIADGTTVQLLVNGVSAGTDTTTGGAYSISGPTISAGDAILVYIDNDDGAANDGVTVTVSDGSDLGGLDIYVDHVITRHDNAGSLTNALMKTAVEPYVDTEILYSVDGSNNLTVSGTGTEVYIPGSQSYAPGADVTTPALKNLGTYNGGTGTNDINGALTINGGAYTATNGTTSIAGDFTISAGSFTHSSGGITLDTSVDKVVNIGAQILNDVTINMGTMNLTITGSMDMDGDLSITAVNQIDTGTIAVAGNVTTTDATVGGSATILFDGAGAQMLSASGGTGAIPAVAINKTGGTLTIQDTIEVEGSNGWTYTAGGVDTGASTVVFSGYNSYTVDAGATIFNNVAVSMGSAEVLTVTGTLDVNGNFSITAVKDINTGTIAVAGSVTTTDGTVTGSATILFDGNNSQVLSASGGTGALPAVTINKSGDTLTIQDTIEVQGSGGWTYTAGGVDAGTSTVVFAGNSHYTVSAGASAFNNVTIKKGSAAVLTVGGALDINGNLSIEGISSIDTGTLMVAGNLASTDAGVSGTAVITLDGTGTQNIDTTGADLPDGVFTINKTSGTAVVISDMTTALDGAGQDLTVSQGTLDLNGFNLTVPDVLTVDANGTLQLEGGETVSSTTATLNAGSTVLYDGAGSYTGLAVGDVYSNVIFNGTGIWTLDVPLDVNTDLTITSGTLDVNNIGNHQINVAGNWSNSGTFTARNGLVMLDGGDQSINGSTTFYSLTKTESSNDSADVTLTFDNTAIQTFNGTLTLDGLDNDDRINLVSDSPGNHWDIVLSATATKAIDYVDVSWSDASGSDATKKSVNPVNSLDSGNTIDWFTYITIDGDFSEWCDGSGTEYCVDDEAGPDDWTSPAELDITRFGVASNRADTFYLLFGFDDTSLSNDSTACVLIDTDDPRNDTIDRVVCVVIDGSPTSIVSVELYNCDDSITAGCGGASLSKTYGASDYGIDNTASGPWDTDTFVEVKVPYSDLGITNGTITFNTLISYPGKSFLKSPKDSIFGNPDQDYNKRIEYDTDDGSGTPISGPDYKSVSGTLYSDEGVTALGSKVVRLIVNGIDRGSNTTDTSGGYFISVDVAQISDGNNIVVYVDDDVDGTDDGTTVSVFRGPDLIDLDIYVDHLIARHDNTGTLTNALMKTAVEPYVDTEILYSVDASNVLTVGGSNTELYVTAGHTFTPGANVSTTHVKVVGTMNGGTDTLAVSGNWSNSGTFVAGSSTVVLNGGNQTISGSTVFNNLTKSESSNDASDVTLTFDNTATQTFNGTLTLDGLDDDDRINLVSDSPGTRWDIVFGAASTKTIDFVDVTDSDASGSDAAKKPVNPADSLNSGNNVDWFYGLTIVKQVWEEGGFAPLGNPTAPVGATLVFLIYVKNTNASAVSDLRINDDLDDTGFDYVEGSLIMDDGSLTDVSSDLDIFNATLSGTGTPLSDAVDANVASGCDVSESLCPGSSMDKMTVGAVVGQANTALNISANETFALRFKVKVK